VVYLAEHPALALVESLANLTGSAASLPSEYQLIKVEVAESVQANRVNLNDLPPLWREEFGHSQEVGDAWLAEGNTALLAVPSAPSPESTNYLFNPLHPEARRIQIEWCRWIAYDSRLLGFRERN